MADKHGCHFTNNGKYTIKSGYQVKSGYPNKEKLPIRHIAEKYGSHQRLSIF